MKLFNKKKAAKEESEIKKVRTDKYPIGMTVKDGDIIYIGTRKWKSKTY